MLVQQEMLMYGAKSQRLDRMELTELYITLIDPRLSVDIVCDHIACPLYTILLQEHC